MVLYNAGGQALHKPVVHGPARLPGGIGQVFCEPRPELFMTEVLTRPRSAPGVDLALSAYLCVPTS